MKQHEIRAWLTAAIFLAGAIAAFAQTAPAPAPNTMSTTATQAMTPAQIAFEHHMLPKSFSTEASAQASCKSTVIWADTKTKLYFPQSSAEFGTAQPGVYACVHDAIKAGYHQSAS
jgi:hypothetical protein